jgi:RNA polymerase sigma-70 factor (ECF subfamily)
LWCFAPRERQSSSPTTGRGWLGAFGIAWFSTATGAESASEDDSEPDELAAEEPADLPPPPSPAPTRDDEHLIRAAQRGDLDAFNLLVLRYERAVFNVCLRLLRDGASAEDVTQETFIKAWQGIGSFRGETIRPWLFRIATNRCYDLLRVRGRRPAASLDAEPFTVEPVWSTAGPGDESPEAHALRHELSIHIERALAALPEDQRTVVLLADVQGCDYQEVAAATGAALGTVKSRLSRARARLRQLMSDDPEAGELFDRYSRHYDEQGEATRP